MPVNLLNKNIRLKNLFIAYLLYLLIFSIYYLFYKHSVSNDSSISEWLINYKGGFTRRGLGGEIAIIISSLFNFSLRYSIFLIQSFLYITFFFFIYLYFKNLRLNWIQVFALFCPLFLLYPVAEIEVLGRKDIVLILYFLLLIFFMNFKWSKNIINFMIIFILPVVVLLWEQIVLFFPFILSLLVISRNQKNFKDVFVKNFFLFLPAIITFFYLFFNPLSRNEHMLMCDYLVINFSEQCYMSAKLLVQNTIYFDTFWVVHENANFSHYLRYILIFLIGFGPLNLLLSQNSFSDKKNFISSHLSLKNFFFLLYSPIILLFIYGYDWGRWTYLMYSYGILLYFFLLKNNFITNKLNFSYPLFKYIKLNKKILISAFLVFAFCWNPKTVITGDIASFPIYRIPYKAVKFLNSF